MLKFIGFFLIVLCGLLAGVLAAFRIGQERLSLDRLCHFLRALSVQMEFRASTVQELLEQLSSEPAYASFSFLDTVAHDLAHGVPLAQAWHTNILHDSAVPECAKEILLPLGDELGTSDLLGQAQTLAQYRDRLESCLHIHSQQYLKKQRLYLSMGLLGGMMAAVLLC